MMNYQRMFAQMLRCFSVLLVFVSIELSAQSDYAISIKGDTLRGEIKFLSVTGNLDKIQINAQGKKTYTSLQVKNISKEGILFQSVKRDNTYRFMKILKSGYLSLYAYNTTDYSGAWDGRFLTKKDGTSLDVPNLEFKKLVSRYLSDCPDVSGQVSKGELAKRNLEEIVDQYNTCLQAHTDQLIALKNTQSAQSFSLDNQKVLAIKKLKDNMEAADFLTKKDALDLLNDIYNKILRNEAVPNYLVDGLKSYLTDTPSLLKEAEDMIALLKK